ncbi:MAG: crossover junction endodeoxyribonuclease RuvC [Clostridia bacterium]|nr:crossover junction endodeoxyribonuclease RuvC [Clostridia bacterium]
MIVLGIDPGYAIIGYGAVTCKNNRLFCSGYGALTTKANMNFNDRLESIFDNMTLMINKCRPDALAIEKLYFNSNQKTAIQVAQARGVILLAAKKAKVSIFEYTPLQIKSAITGYGRAEKKQVMRMTQKLLHLDKLPSPDDAADALAIAICHIHTIGSDLKFKILHNKGL